MKRFRLIIILVTALVFGFLAFVIFHDREPRYQGRTLSEWITESRYVMGDDRFLDTNSAWQAVRRNVQQMAPEAIPWLLKWAQLKDSGLKRKIANWLDARRFLHVHIKSEWEFKRDAGDGFKLLGDAARPAWPALIQLTQSPDPDRRVAALTCLFESRPGKEILLPVLLRMIHDSSMNVRINAAGMLHYRFPAEAETAGVYKMLPRFKALPTEQSITNQAQNK